MVIALDSPTNSDVGRRRALRTNNFNAGVLIGKYARAATKGKTVTIAMLDEHAGLFGRRASPQRLPQGLRHQVR